MCGKVELHTQDRKMAEQEPRELLGVKIVITSTIPPQHVSTRLPHSIRTITHHTHKSRHV